jgi:hypothetical protein
MRGRRHFVVSPFQARRGPTQVSLSEHSDRLLASVLSALKACCDNVRDRTETCSAALNAECPWKYPQLDTAILVGGPSFNGAGSAGPG